MKLLRKTQAQDWLFHEIKIQGQQDDSASKDINHQAEDLSSILGTHQVEGENQPLYVVL